MRAMSKRAWKGVGLFVKLVRDEFDRRDLTLTESTPFDPQRPDSHFCYMGTFMTEAGRVDLSLYDFLHMNFALPLKARDYVACSLSSGKYNIHHEREAFGNQDYTVKLLQSIVSDLDRLNIRPWTIEKKLLTQEELAEKPLYKWLDLEMMGFQFQLEGLDRKRILLDFCAEIGMTHDRPGDQKLFLEMQEPRSDIAILRMIESYRERHPPLEEETLEVTSSFGR